MDKRIARLGAFLLVCYAALFGMLNYIQVFKAESLNDNPENRRAILRDFSGPRGTIETADGVVVARSVEVDDEFERQREYPAADLFAQITGYFSFAAGATGVERHYNDELAGQTAEQQLEGFADAFVDREQVGNIVLTLRNDLQELARDQLAGRCGSVVVLDPRTGGILAMYSHPSYDPNALASHDLDAVSDALQFANETRECRFPPRSPLVPAAYREVFFPGSTMKVVVAGIGVESGRVTPEEPNYPSESSFTPPQTTRPLSNFGGNTCGGTLFEIVAQSCDTAFARMGVETLGPELMIDGTQNWGFNQRPPIDLSPGAVASNFPTDFDQNLPALAQSSIGQNDVQTTPLQMALVAAGVANGGVIMEPHVVHEIRDDEGEVVDEENTTAWQQPMSAQSASLIRQSMIGVIQGGTGEGLGLPGLEVGAKTGTAQLGTTPPSSHTWFISFAGPPGGEPEVAVAVIIEGQEGVSEVTGAELAGPVAQTMMQAALD